MLRLSIFQLTNTRIRTNLYIIAEKNGIINHLVGFGITTWALEV